MSSAKIKRYLKDSNIALAITELKNIIEGLGNYDLTNALDDVQKTYTAMLTYMLQGYMDVDSSARRDDIIRTLFSIVDKTDRLISLNQEDKSTKYFAAFKSVQTTTFENIIQRLEVDLSDADHEEELCKLFNWAWTSNVWSKSEYESANQLLNSESIAVNDKAVFISAITLALMDVFDVRKVHLLFDAYLFEDGNINQRALVGIVLILRMYDSRLKCYPEIISRVEMYSDNPHFITEFFSAITMLQHTLITDKVSSKMMSEIFPTLMKKHQLNNPMSTSELKMEMVRNGENPEWVDDTKVRKSFNAMSELIQEGADVYMSSFRYMKGYPFFNAIPHWFYPFAINSYLINNGKEIPSSILNTLKIVESNNAFCNSDLYSFSLAMLYLGNMNNDLLNIELSKEIQQEEMSLLLEDAKKKTKENKFIRRSYIFDLYRFFACLPYKNQFYNPFKVTKKNADGKSKVMTFSPLETDAFSFMLTYREHMIDLAEFFMRKEFYEEALAMYQIINPQEIEEDANLWQKIGFCKQKLGKDKSAYKTYLMADTLLPDSKWTMSHIAQLAQKLEIYDTALSFYDLLLQQDDENMKYLVNKAKCEMKLNMFDDAITTLFKASYLDESSIEIREMMINCYLMNGQSDKAFDLLEKIITNSDCSIDMRILYALILLKSHSIQYANNALRESIIIYKEKEDSVSYETLFDNMLKKYSPHLQIEESTARMLFDSIILDIL